MAKEKVMAPEVDLIRNDVFYMFYEMMTQTLKTDNVKDGLSKSFSILKTFLNSGMIFLFRKDNNGLYEFTIRNNDKIDDEENSTLDSTNEGFINSIKCIVNKTKNITEKQNFLDLNLELSERLDNLMLIYQQVDNYDCIIAIINNDKNKNLGPLFWERLRDTLQIILKRAASYEKNNREITYDSLTGVFNRNFYDKTVKNIQKEKEDLVVGLFDLFRLKFINDNYTHEKGDEYIKNAAEILKKYWPREGEDEIDNPRIDLPQRGHRLYRIGGDEFVLFTTKESLKLADKKANLASIEAEMIDLGVDGESPIGLNFGVVDHNPGDHIKSTIMKADEKMQENKKVMYKRYDIDRRR